MTKRTDKEIMMANRQTSLVKFAVACAIEEIRDPSLIDAVVERYPDSDPSPGMWQSFQDDFSGHTDAEWNLVADIYTEIVTEMAGATRGVNQRFSRY